MTGLEGWQGPPEREGRPVGSGPAGELSTPIKNSTSVTTPVADCTAQPSLELCPLHGDPEAAAEAIAYGVGDLDTWQMPELVSDEVWDLLSVLAENHLEPGSCGVCDEILFQDSRARYPGWSCEDGDHLHCTECRRCAICKGDVCRNCRRCLEHTDPWGPCGYPRWDPRLRREVWASVHTTYNRATGRWR